MKRPERTHVKPRNDMPPVPEIQGRAKTGNKRANPIGPAQEGAGGPAGKVHG